MGARLAAKAVDWLVLLVVLGVLSVPLALVLLITGSPAAILPWSGTSMTHLGVGALHATVTVAYFTWAEATRGRTPGKRVLNLTVVNEQGRRPTGRQALLRNLWMALFVVPVVGVPAQALAAVAIAVTISRSPTRRGWHDELADTTRVVHAE